MASRLRKPVGLKKVCACWPVFVVAPAPCRRFKGLIVEEPVVIYSYIEPETFALRLSELRAFIHRLGIETDQGQMAFEFDGEFYLIDFAPAAT
jgi:hypothetical protein